MKKRYHYIKSCHVRPDDSISDYRLLSATRLRLQYRSGTAIRIDTAGIPIKKSASKLFFLSADPTYSIRDCAPVEMVCVDGRWRPRNGTRKKQAPC